MEVFNLYPGRCTTDAEGCIGLFRRYTAPIKTFPESKLSAKGPLILYNLPDGHLDSSQDSISKVSLVETACTAENNSLQFPRFI